MIKTSSVNKLFLLASLILMVGFVATPSANAFGGIKRVAVDKAAGSLRLIVWAEGVDRTSGSGATSTLYRGGWKIDGKRYQVINRRHCKGGGNGVLNCVKFYITLPRNWEKTLVLGNIEVRFHNSWPFSDVVFRFHLQNVIRRGAVFKA